MERTDVPEPELDAFIAAARDGDIGRMLPYLEKYEALMNDDLQSGGTGGEGQRPRYEEVQKALYEAAGQDHAEVVDLLLTKGFHIDQTTILKALASSREKSSLETFKVLLKHGWDVNHNMGHLGDAITWAALKGNTALVSWLLANGANPDQNRHRDEFTALECAAEDGHLASVKVLVEAGAQVRGRSALSTAAANGRVDIVDYLLSVGGADIDGIPDNEEIQYFDKDNDAKNALCAAAEHGRAEVVRFLLKRGADKGITDKHGKTPLQLAEIKGHEDCIELLK